MLKIGRDHPDQQLLNPVHRKTPCVPFVFRELLQQSQGFRLPLAGRYSRLPATPGVLTNPILKEIAYLHLGILSGLKPPVQLEDYRVAEFG